VNPRYRKAMRLKSRHHRHHRTLHTLPAPRRIIPWATEPCGDSWPLPQTVSNNNDLIGQRIKPDSSQTMKLVKLVGDLL
jgi:hypothetical protein